MDCNAEELHRLWEEIRQGTTTSCSSLTTEKHSDTHSNLSTPSLISNLDLPSPLSAFSVEIEDIFNFELDEVLPPSPTEQNNNSSEAILKSITNQQGHSDKCVKSTTEDTTTVTNTRPTTRQHKEEALDPTPLPGHNTPVSTPKVFQYPGETSKENRKRPLSPSVPHHGSNQKNLKVERPPTPVPPYRKSERRHYRPPPLLIEN